VKQAEDGNGLIVRLYEAAGASTHTMLHCGFALDTAHECDLIEENPARLPLVGDGICLTFGPFEIRTLRFLPRWQ
jgi:alpha-mannosidase